MIISFGQLRHKARSIPDVIRNVPASEQRDINTNALQLTFGGGPLTTHSGSSTIVYTTRSKARPSAANMCRHLITALDYSGDVNTVSRVNWADHGVYFNLYDAHTFSSVGHALAVTAAKTSFNTNIGDATLAASAQAFINDAATRLRPDLTTMSAPNFLYEIKQITSLVELWKKNLSLAKNLAGAFLNYKFGWRPTNGDILQMIDGVSQLEQKLREFVAHVGQIQSGQVTCLKETVTTSGLLTIDVNKRCKWFGTLTKSVAGFVVWAPQPLAVLDNFDKTLRGLMDVFGVQFNPRIVWDAMPFTFIIDWFFGVGAWLETFSVDALELPIKYVDSYLQYKESIKIESYSYMDPGLQPGNTQVGREVSGGWVTTEQRFQRFPIFPDYATLAGLGWKVPTIGQTTLLVALATVLAPVQGGFKLKPYK